MKHFVASAQLELRYCFQHYWWSLANFSLKIPLRNYFIVFGFFSVKANEWNLCVCFVAVWLPKRSLCWLSRRIWNFSRGLGWLWAWCSKLMGYKSCWVRSSCGMSLKYVLMKAFQSQKTLIFNISFILSPFRFLRFKLHVARSQWSPKSKTFLIWKLYHRMWDLVFFF